MRIQLPQTENYVFETEYSVVISDINYGGHLGNDKYLSIAHECRTRFYHWLGFSEKNIGQTNIGTIMANAVVNYKAEAFHGDELTVCIAVENIGRSNFDIIYKIMRNHDVIAEILTTILAFHSVDKKVKSIPQIFLEKLQALSS